MADAPSPGTGTGSSSLEIPGYRILGRLGEGAMGQVYRAEQVDLGRPVAIKVLSEELSRSPTLLARFNREATFLA